MGEIVLHPEHPLFKQFRHVACPECRREILPMTPIAIEMLPDGRALFRHAECAPKPEEDAAC